MPTMTLRQALDIIESGSRFDIEFVACDVERGTAGELKAYKEVLKSSAIPKRWNSAADKRPVKRRVMSNHDYNSTINIWIPSEQDRSQRIRKVHTRLITKINGIEVL